MLSLIYLCIQYHLQKRFLNFVSMEWYATDSHGCYTQVVYYYIDDIEYDD